MIGPSTPTEIAAYTALGGAAIGGAIKLGTWFFSTLATRTADRRASLDDIITRQKEEIDSLRTEVRAQRAEALQQEAQCDERIRTLERRVDDEARARAQMEGLLYRMGWERTARGWKRNGHGDPEGGGAHG